ncbi:MAG: (Fe-S)-binding protein, partial [Planctomycetes bacterium]|nr:(Fe-S)-binding protein [Planctomycetota bacterium]
VALLARDGWEPPRKKFPGRWALALPCHERHGPAADPGLARSVLDSALERGCSEMPAPDHCCGAAGFYFLRRARLSRAIGREALARFEASGAEGVISGNPGCLLRWEGLLAPSGGKALHPVVAVDLAYRL